MVPARINGKSQTRNQGEPNLDLIDDTREMAVKTPETPVPETALNPPTQPDLHTEAEPKDQTP